MKKVGRILGVVILVASAILLSGCLGIQTTNIPENSGPQVKISIGADNRTVMFDASDYLNYAPKGLKFYWDFLGTGSFTEGDPIMVFKYPAPGVYYCRLKVEGWPGSGGGGTGGGAQQGPGGIGGGSSSGQTSAKYRALTVDLLQKNYPVVVLTIFDTLHDDVDAQHILTYTPILLDASKSYSPDDDYPLWFRWEIVYVEQDPATGEWVPKPYPWQCTDPSLCPTEPEWLRFTGPTVYLKYGLKGPVCCLSPQPYWHYRVRVWVTDNSGRTSFKEQIIRVWPC
jgi:hypothetical protein